MKFHICLGADRLGGVGELDTSFLCESKTAGFANAPLKRNN